MARKRKKKQSLAYVLFIYPIEVIFDLLFSKKARKKNDRLFKRSRRKLNKRTKF